jgi:uncharacterized SAM-binding protein YcdF (DUF218 family)
MSLLFLCTGLAAGAWLAGLFLFVAEVRTAEEPVIDAALPPSEAIVVLTGGSDRLATGLALLMAGKGSKLLISGVHPGLTLNKVLARQAVPQNLRDCCIFLGHVADNTIGNAEETRAWMESESFRSVRLVTANYHMPRSLLIFRAHLPNATIIPHTVAPESVKMGFWWLRPGTAGLLMMEYNKYLYTLARAWTG